MTHTYINQLKGHISDSATIKKSVRLLYTLGLSALITSSWVACRSANEVGAQNESKMPSAQSVEPAATTNSNPDPEMAILSKIVKYKKANPSITAQALADYGNELLPALGFDYDFDMEKTIQAKTRAKVTKPVKKPGDDATYISFPFQISSESGAKATLNIIAPDEASCCCGYYYTPIPVTQVSVRRLTIVVNGKPVAVRRTKEFPVVQEYILYKDRNHPKKVRSWEVPYETYPYGLSVDSLTLFIETDVPDLLLGISSENGNLRFVPKTADNIVKDGEDLRKLPPPKEGEAIYKSGEYGLIQYIIAGKPFVLEFPYPCT